MTQHPHPAPGTPGGTHTGPSGQSTQSPNRPLRRQRIRGCGVPPSIWFTPHPDTTEPTVHTSAQTPDWALAEILRQFTSTGQNYAIAGIPAHRETPNQTVRFALHHCSESATATAPENDNTPPQSRLNHLAVVLPEPPTPAGNDTFTDDCEGLKGAFAEHLPAAVAEARALLHDGGILAVVMPRPTPGAGFTDGTGKAIQAARLNGFAYIQHIALVDSFIADEGITPALPQRDLDVFWAARARGLRVHARSHSDLLILRKIGKADTLD